MGLSCLGFKEPFACCLCPFYCPRLPACPITVPTDQGHQFTYKGFHLFGLGIHLFRGRGRLLGIGCILLDDLVHLGHGLVDLINALGLFIGGSGNFCHKLICLGYALVHFRECIIRPSHKPGPILDTLDSVFDQVCCILGGLSRPHGKIPYLFCHHCKSGPMLSGTCRLNRCIQCKQVCLKGDLIDCFYDLGSLFACLRYLFHRTSQAGHGIIGLADYLACLLHEGICLTGIVRILFCHGSHLFQGRRCLLNARCLLCRTLGQGLACG